MSTWQATLNLDYPGRAEARAVHVLSTITLHSAGSNSDWRDEAASDIIGAMEHDSSFGLSPEFERWERRLQSLTGAWWELDTYGFFTVHY